MVESMMIPIATPIGVEIANANAYNAHDKRGRFGNMRNSAIPIAIAAKTLCKDTVHRAFHALDFVSAIPIAMPSNTEWKHRAKMSNTASPTVVVDVERMIAFASGTAAAAATGASSTSGLVKETWEDRLWL